MRNELGDICQPVRTDQTDQNDLEDWQVRSP
jgi:hypothetical protein